MPHLPIENTGTSTVLRRIREDGGEDAWESFVRRYWRVIHGYAIGAGLDAHLVEDLTQVVLLELVAILPTFEVNPEIGSFRSLLRIIVKRRVVDQIRKSTREAEAMQSPKTDARDKEFDPSDALFNQVWKEGLLRAALAEVRERTSAADFQAFDLMTNSDVPGAEVAKLLGISKNSVYQAKSRVARDIRETMERLDLEAR